MKTDDIQPLTEHRAHLTEHFKQVRDTGRPMFITSNGRTAAVVLSPAAYDDLTAKAELAENLAAIDRSIADIEAGRVHDARTAMRKLAKAKGIKLKE